MTTADIALGFSDFGWWLFGLEEKATEYAKRLALAAADWIVDRLRWFRREVARRRGYPTGARRADRNERGFTVWDYLHSVPLEELKYEQKPRGQHRDRRGWRYSGISMVRSLVQRGTDERVWTAFWAGEVDRLMDDIQYMLDHPPLPSSVTVHGCQDCLCGQIADLRAEALA